jgi:hypothetical protein
MLESHRQPYVRCRARSHAGPPRRSVLPAEASDRSWLMRDDSVAGEWVVLGSQRLLWLPPYYRATCTAVNGWNMVLGHSSGRVSYLHFDFSAAGPQNRFFNQLNHPPRFPLVI